MNVKMFIASAILAVLLLSGLVFYQRKVGVQPTVQQEQQKPTDPYKDIQIPSKP